MTRPDNNVMPSSIPTENEPIPTPKEVLGVGECQAGLAQISKTPAVGSAGMLPCSGVILVDKANDRMLILHATQPSGMKNADPHLAKFLGIQGTEEMTPEELNKAIKNELAQRPKDSIQLVTVAGPSAQRDLDRGDKDTSTQQVLKHLSSLDETDAITHFGHGTGKDFIFDARTMKLYTNESNLREEVLAERFKPDDYDWGPYSDTRPRGVGGVPGAPQQLNRIARDDGTRGEKMFMVMDNVNENAFEQQQREAAADLIASMAVERAFGNDPNVSDGRKAEMQKMIADRLKKDPQFVGNRGLQNEVVRAYHADNASSSTNKKMDSGTPKMLADKSLVFKLADQTKQSLQDHPHLGERPGGFRKAFNPGRVKDISKAKESFESNLDQVVTGHGVEKEPMAMAVKRDTPKQMPEAPKIGVVLRQSGSLKVSSVDDNQVTPEPLDLKGPKQPKPKVTKSEKMSGLVSKFEDFQAPKEHATTTISGKSGITKTTERVTDTSVEQGRGLRTSK